MAAGLAALMLTVGIAGVAAEAVEYPVSCGHSWTVDEKFDEIQRGREKHMVDLRKCTITHIDVSYIIM